MKFHHIMALEHHFAVSSSTKGKKVRLVNIELNEYDNDPDHFWTTFTNTLSLWNNHFTQHHRQTPFPKSNSASTQFLSEFTNQLHAEPFMLIFSNGEMIQNSAVLNFIHKIMNIDEKLIHASLTYTQEIFTDKSKDSHSNISGGCIFYISETEEAQFYKERNIILSDEDFHSVHTFTEGWFAAVRAMAVLFIEHGSGLMINLKNNIENWIENVFYKQYTTTELERLFFISLLDSFSIELFCYICGWNGEAIDYFMSGSPIIRYDTETKEYHYSKYLLPKIQERLVLFTHKQKLDFYTKVADWYKEHGQIIEAFKYYRKAGANHKILQILKTWTFSNTREMANCYVDTINEMPPHYMEKHPMLHVIRGYMLATLYRYRDAQILMEEFCRTNDRGKHTPKDIRPLLGEAYLLLGYSYICLMRNDADIISLYKRASELLPGGSTLYHKKINQYADSPAIRLANPETGALEQFVKFLHDAEPYLNIACSGYCSGIAHLAEAEMHYYRRNFKEVPLHARKAIVMAEHKELYDIACSGYFLLMRFNFAKGNYKKTIESFNMLKHLAKGADYDDFFCMPDLAESWLNLKLGQKNKVADWIHDESVYQKKVKPWNYGRDRILRCDYLLTDQQFEALLGYADSSIDLLRKRGYNLLILQLQLMKALALNKVGEEDKSVRVFEEVYRWTHQNQIVMPIIEFGGSLRPMIESCRRDSDCIIPDEWLNDIAVKANSYYNYQYHIRKQHELKQSSRFSLMDNLTLTEKQLLHLISHGMTAQEIAESQGKTLGTVKGMIRRVYSKIGARNMADAVRITVEYNMENGT